MRIFVAGATGVISRSLIPQLIDPGHSVTAMTRDPDRAEGITSQCAEAVVWDVYDTKGVVARIEWPGSSD